MWEGIGDRLVELGRRAGVTGVPAPVIAAALALCTAACVWGAWRFWPRDTDGVGADGATPVVIEGAAAAASGAAGGGKLASGTAEAAGGGGVPGSIVVHVVGSVRHPDVYELPTGSRVSDAVAKAGGVLPDAHVEAVNLARVLADGEQIVIPDEDAVAAGAVPGAGAGAAGAGSAGAGAPSPGAAGAPGAAGPVDLNSADVAALDTLPGVGPATAAKIVAEREANGPFASVADLTRVPGIGEKKVAQLEGLACVR